MTCWQFDSGSRDKGDRHAEALNFAHELPVSAPCLSPFSCTAVPVTATVSGGASGTNTNGYSITMFIPEDSTTRTTKEQARIDSAKTADGGSDAAGLAWMNANNTKALAALDRIYTQSRVGAFTITVTYVSTKSGLWNGTVTSTSIIANVENEGSQLDNIPN